MTRKQRALAYLALTAYALVVGFSFMSVKVCVGRADPLQTVTFRFTAAFLAALAVKLAGGARFRLKKESLPGLAAATLTYVGFMGLQAFGMLYTTSIISGILFAAVPVFTRLAAGLVLKESSTWVQNAFALLSVGAVMAMFALSGGDELKTVDGRGFALLLLSSISCAVSNVYMRRVKQEYRPLPISFCSCTVGFVLFWGLALGRMALQGGVGDFFAPLADRSFVGAAVYLGVGCTLITGALISYGLRYLPAMSATVFGNLSTAISVVAGALLLGEPLYGYQLVCTVLIIAGVLGISFFTGREGEANGN